MIYPNQSEQNPLDHFFARRTLERSGNYTEEGALFLSALMENARAKNICWEPKEAKFEQAVEALPKGILSEPSDLSLSSRWVYPTTPVVKTGKNYYLQKNWVYETYLLKALKRMGALTPPPFHDEEQFFQLLHQATERGTLLPEQAQAVSVSFKTLFSLICGGPGTGKTYTAAMLIHLLLASLKKEIKPSYKILLSAPTGKAAAHLQSTLLANCPSEFSGKIEAATLHRILKLSPGKNRLFSPAKIDADLIVVDEASMLDLPLLIQLLEAISDQTRLVLMGDPNQLPPVDEISLFAEMATLLAKPLKKSLRTKESSLHRLATSIQEGSCEKVEALFEENQNSVKRLSWSFDETLAAKLYEELEISSSFQEPDLETSLTQLNQLRILGALRQGPFGIDALNQKIVEKMAQNIRPRQWWTIPIMIPSNQPRLDLYNGSCGILVGMSTGGNIDFRRAVAYFPDERKGGIRSFKTAPPFEVAFCLSIHKSQGSEFERVIALFPRGSENFGREAIYTAATRAKREFAFVGGKRNPTEAACAAFP